MTDWFAGKLAVVTGGGSGMGRELVRQLAARGCSVATCDLYPDTAAATAALAQDAAAGAGVLVTSHTCDVSDEAQVLRFRDELLQAHAASHLDLVFSNAGIGGGESFVSGRRQDWERVFAKTSAPTHPMSARRSSCRGTSAPASSGTRCAPAAIPNLSS
jgi:NAD(P)-dependent dehydrogenase (short-subunit alcohol dehydrogenase family)